MDIDMKIPSYFYLYFHWKCHCSVPLSSRGNVI